MEGLVGKTSEQKENAERSSLVAQEDARHLSFVQSVSNSLTTLATMVSCFASQFLHCAYTPHNQREGGSLRAVDDLYEMLKKYTSLKEALMVWEDAFNDVNI